MKKPRVENSWHGPFGQLKLSSFLGYPKNYTTKHSVSRIALFVAVIRKNKNWGLNQSTFSTTDTQKLLEYCMNASPSNFDEPNGSILFLSYLNYFYGINTVY
jgi:hypothetical protein